MRRSPDEHVQDEDQTSFPSAVLYITVGNSSMEIVDNLYLDIVHFLTRTRSQRRSQDEFSWGGLPLVT